MQDVSLTDPPALIGDTADQLAKIFGSGVAGAIPNGRGKGTVLIGTGGPLARLAAALAYALAWRGKVVNAREGRLKNLVTQDSWYDGETCIVLDYSKTSFVARKIRDEIREIAPGVFLGLVFWGRRHVLDFALDFRERR